jgi:translocation and assembly module TamB
VRLALASADISVATAELSWRPVALVNGQVQLPYLEISGLQVILAEQQEQQQDSSVGMPSLLLPLMVLVDNFVLRDAKFLRDDATLLYQVDFLHLALEGFKNSIQLHDLELRAPDARVQLHGLVQTDRDWRMDLLGGWSLAGFGFHRMEGTFSLVGPIAAPHLGLGISAPAQIRIDADVTDLPGDPRWKLNLHGTRIDLSRLIVNCPPIELLEIEATMEGDLARYRGQVTALGDWEDLTGMRLNSRLAGDFQGIDFGYLRIDRPSGYAQAVDGRISWAEIFDWKARLHLQDFDLSSIDKKLEGTVTADIVNEGKVVENGVRGAFELISLESTLKGRKISAAGNVHLLESSVSTDGLTVHSDGIEGVAHIDEAMFSWQDEMSWHLSMRLENFNPDFLFPELAGSLSGEFDGKGKFRKDGPEVRMDIRSLAGTLRGREISGEGGLRYEEGALESPGFILRSGQSVLAVQGKKEKEVHLAFTFTSPDLEDLLADAHGEVHLDGNLSGNMESPQLRLNLAGKGLAYQDKAVRELNVQFRGELSEEGRIDARSVIKGARLGTSIELDGEIAVAGDLPNYGIDIRLATAGTAVQLSASGAYLGSWQGSLNDFMVESAQFGTWKQKQAAGLALGPAWSKLEDICLAGEAGEFCVNGRIDNDDTPVWQGNVDWKSVPMSELYRAGVPSSPLTGLLDGRLSFAGEGSALRHAELETGLVDPVFRFDTEDEQVQVFPLDAAKVSAKISENEVVSSFFLHSAESGSLDLTVTLEGGTGPGLPPAAYLDLPVRGKLVVDNLNPEILTAYTEYLIEPKGQFRSSFTVEGTLNHPQLHGELVLENGVIAIPSQGMSLEDFKVSLTARENGATVNCSAKSGPGTVEAAGYLSYTGEGIDGDLKITGTDFLLVDLPEYVLRVSPDVRFLFNKDKGEITGRVTVPYALITPEEMTGSVKESSDVVFIEGEQEIKETGWPFYLDLNVELGEDVSVDGYGLTGKLGGELDVKISPGDFITGVGELLLQDGVFTIYGRSLNIERGVVKFTGGPIDNPGIDVRAKKTVSDKEAKGEGYTVGIDISGLMQDLKFQLFSYPYMEETEILSYMIAGHSLSDSTTEEGNMLQSAATTLGIAGSGTVLKPLGDFLSLDDMHLEGSQKDEDVSLVVGKNVTDDLYIGYDLNLFNEVGQFRVRYDLTHGFWVETKSSSESTSAELFYSFER